MKVRDCETCAHAQPFGGEIDNRCDAWECEYINRKEAIEAYKARREKENQMRLIDADKLKADVVSWENCYNGFSDTYDKAMIIDTIDEQPTIEAEPVRRGRWIPVKGYEGILYKCSVCDGRWSHTTIKTPYCSQCGAKMEDK